MKEKLYREISYPTKAGNLTYSLTKRLYCRLRGVETRLKFK